MNPPLRSEDDRQALIEGLRSGTIDCIATDHAPHTSDEKEVPFEQAAMGVTGLETAFAVLHTDLVLPGVLELGDRWSSGSAAARSRSASRRRGSRRGAEANLVLCDLDAEWEAGRGRLGEPLRQLLLRRAQAARPGADDGRRRPGRLPPAQLRDGGA